MPNEEIRAMLNARYAGVAELPDLKERYIVNLIREVLDMSHGRWLWSEAARERWRLRDSEATSTAEKLKRLAKKLACYPFASRPGLDLLSKLERKASWWLKSVEYYIDLFEELKPSLVFNASQAHSRLSIQAVQAAQWMNIPTASFIFSWDNLTSQGRIIPQSDYYLVWNEELKDQLLKLYSSVTSDRVFVTGTPQFDFHFRPEYYWDRNEFCLRVGADESRPIVLYTTGMPNHMPGEPEIVEGIANILREMPELGPPQLLVRVYAKDRSGRFDDLKRKYPDILFPKVPWEPAWLTPEYDDCYMLTNTLRYTDLGINVASTVSLELCMFDKPVINVGYGPGHCEANGVEYSRYYKFDHYRPVVDSGAVQVAYSPEDMRHFLREALLHPDRRARERKALVRRFFGNNLDGWSATRVAGVLQLLAAKGFARRDKGGLHDCSNGRL
jgi:hypothetical protein